MEPCTLSNARFEVERKNKILVVKWNSLCKHVRHQKVVKNMGFRCEKREQFYSKVCKHAKNWKTLASYSQKTIDAQLAHGVVKEKVQKVVQFSTTLHLLQQGCPMVEYESLRLLFDFLVVPKNSKKHQNDSFNWTMAKFMHQVMMKAIKVVVEVTHYIVLSCNEVSTIDNQSWMFILYYVVQNWVKIPILIFLDTMVTGSRSDNLIKVIMQVIMIGGGLPQNQIAQKLICFGVDGVNVFQRTRTSVTKQIHDSYAPNYLGIHCMAHEINLVVQTFSSLFLVICLEHFVNPTQLVYTFTKKTSKVYKVN